MSQTLPSHDRSELAGLTINCLTRYDVKGPSSRLRFMQYGPALEAAGANVAFYPLLSDGYLERLYDGRRQDKFDIGLSYLRRIGDIAFKSADMLWIEKELFPYLPSAFERLAAVRRIPYAVDFDDAIFHNYDLHPRGQVRALMGSKLDPLLRGSAMVTAGNAYLADYASRHGAARIEIVPTVVDTRRYPCDPPVPNERLRIGWIGTPNNARYLAPVITALNQLNERLPVTLVTVGIGELPCLTVPHERHDWMENEEGRLANSFDIGVMPLVDTPWERGKCGYKLIQYMAAARPVIASSVGVNREIVTHSVGRLVEKEEGWIAAITELGSDPSLRQQMGDAARRRVEEHYSLAATGPTIVKLFEGMAVELKRSQF
jgi:glycosyltransferase involved in cell wall biosynthesis